MSQVQLALCDQANVLIAVGSNAISPWGDARATVVAAIARVQERLGARAQCSQLYQTPAFPPGAGPDFVNACFAIATGKPALEVLGLLHQIEAEAARKRDLRWGQRSLDLDLIAAGDLVAPDRATYLQWLDLPLDQQMKAAPDQLILPHPRMQDRAFVLRPLMDVAPDWTHPVSGLSVRQMLAKCSTADRKGVVPLALQS